MSVAARDQPPPVRREVQGADGAQALVQDAPRLVSAHLPEPDSSLLSPGGNRLPLRREGQAGDALFMAPQEAALARGHVPQAHRAVLAARDQPLPLRGEGEGCHLTVMALPGTQLLESAIPQAK